jgi:hypothetical protein
MFLNLLLEFILSIIYIDLLILVAMVSQPDCTAAD